MGSQVIQDGKGKRHRHIYSNQRMEAAQKTVKELEKLEFGEPAKEQLLRELKEAVHELGLIEQGKLTARPAAMLLDEL